MRSAWIVTMMLMIVLNAKENGMAEGKTKEERANAMRKEFLDGQNEARRQVGVAELKWDENLRKYASWYMRKRRSDCALEHSQGSPYGENMFWGKGHKWTPAQAVNAWVEQAKWYDHKSNKCSGPDCTHFTQVVWRTSTRVGCSHIRCLSGDTLASCNYYPPGNYVGARPY